mgnify:CR=1 FL=1
MAAPTPTTEPTTLIAGDTARWIKALPDYLASAGWVLTYTLINATGKITFSASAYGDDHLVNVSAATTGGWAAGSYSWRAAVALAGEVYTVDTGTIVVQPAFGVATLDNRSFARIALANIEAYLVNPANLSVTYVTVSPTFTTTLVLGYLSAYGVDNDATTLTGAAGSSGHERVPLRRPRPSARAGRDRPPGRRGGAGGRRADGARCRGW